MNPLPVILADMRRRPTGISAVILLIAFAVALGVAVSTQERAVRQGANRAAEPFDLIVGAPGSQTQLLMSTVYLQPAAVDLMDGAVLSDLTRAEDVDYAAPIGFGDAYQGYPIVGSTAAFASLNGRRPPVKGRLFTKINEAVVGADVALNLGDEFNPVHGQVHLEEEEQAHVHETMRYTVVGRLARWNSPWDRAIIVPIEAVWAIHGLSTGHHMNEKKQPKHSATHDHFSPIPVNHQHDHRHNAEHEIDNKSFTDTHDTVGSEDNAHDHEQKHDVFDTKIRIGPPWDKDELPGVPAIVVGVKKPAQAYKLRSRFRQREDTMAFFPAEVLLEMYALMGDVRTILAAIAVATQVLVVAAVLLAVLATLAQKRRQLGILRALGASRRYVFAVIWTHITLIITTGALLGLGIGYFGGRALSFSVARSTGLVMPVAITFTEVGMIAVLLAIGALLAIVPSAMIYWENVATLLRE